MKPRSRHTVRYGYSEPTLLPPILSALGPIPFTPQDFETLDAWLAEEGWPNDRMDVAMLEGYLIALIVWPIELAPGAWLPAIWGIRGWKVAAKIATSQQYNRFIALVVGMFQDLERRLTASPPLQSLVLGAQTPYLSGRYFAGAAWATGFMTALRENSEGLASRSATVRCAVEDIAKYASLRSAKPARLAASAVALNAAVTTIMSERPATGPRAFVRLNRQIKARPLVIAAMP